MNNKDKGYTGPGSGIRKQMMDSENREYKDFTTKDLEDIMNDLTKGEPTFMERLSKELHPDDHLPNPKGLTPEGQIKRGYLYQMGEGKWSAITGYAGILEYVKALREKGFDDTYILNEIRILDTEGIMTNTKYLPLINVEWKRIPFWKRVINKHFKKS